jgi:hypothetical protein
VEGARHTCERHNTERPSGTHGNQDVAVHAQAKRRSMHAAMGARGHESQAPGRRPGADGERGNGWRH